MQDQISIFQGATSNKPKGSTQWQKALENIRSGKYEQAIKKARAIQDPVEYRSFKKKLPGVTFGGQFDSVRNKANISSPTGFIIPDIDHIQDVEYVFNLLRQDEYVWFAFRSPSGDGLKCGFRAHDIKTDEDHKKLFSAVERYLKLVYGIEIDPSCKDISRLTFVSHDPDLYINPSPCYFEIKKWLEEPRKPRPVTLPETKNNGWQEKYGRKVLESSCREIEESVLGNKHYTRLRMARLVGGFIASGFIDEQEALIALEQAVKNNNAKPLQPALKTVRDGIEHGKMEPVYPESNFEDTYSSDIVYDLSDDEGSQHTKQTKHTKHTHNHKASLSITKHCKASLSNAKHPLSNDDPPESVENPINPENNEVGTDVATRTRAHARGRETEIKKNNTLERTKEPPHNLKAAIFQFIETSKGEFTTQKIDNEFGLRTRKEKNARSWALNKAVSQNLIKKDKKTAGKYHIIDTDIDFIDLDAESEEDFPIRLPFDLHNYVKIPHHAIIILAGSSNAGKTALILETLRLNLKQKYPKHYYMSEMAPGEYKNRLLKFDIPLEEWKKVKAASKSYDFDGAIQTHNPDGLTCIDYLEEVDGEYFKIASSIRDIYDALGSGVAMIAVQKRRASEVAVGGEGTAEKARLYLTLDFLCAKEHSIVCAIKVYKNKEPRGNRSIINNEMHFEIKNGSKFKVLMDWTPSSKVNRQKCAAQYEAGRTDIGENDFIIKTVEGQRVAIKNDQIQKWQKTFENIDVSWEVKRIAEDSEQKPFLKYKKSGFMFQVANILAKTDEERS